MSISANITNDMKAAMKAKDKVALTAIRALKTAFTNAAIEKGGLGTELTDAEEMAIVRKQLKQRQDSIEQFVSAGREELAEGERAEVAILEKYLPAPLTEEEVSAIIAEAIAETGASSRADMGKVMKLVQEKTAGRADGKTLSQGIMKALS